MGLSNQNPIIYKRNQRHPKPPSSSSSSSSSTSSAAIGDDKSSIEAINPQEVFDRIRDILDPEHPYSLEELKVVSEDAIQVDNDRNHVRVTFTPTVPHCGLVVEIALLLREKLVQSLPRRYLVEIVVAPGTHYLASVITKRVNDKERIANLMEEPEPELLELFDRCLAPTIRV